MDSELEQAMRKHASQKAVDRYEQAFGDDDARATDWKVLKAIQWTGHDNYYEKTREVLKEVGLLQ